MGTNSIPYLGSKISLVSKSEIRYEGVLYTIDPNESTVALAKVRSFGTEDRPTDRPVGPRDEVYEYIIFRGKDIKDIRVCGPPKPQPTLTGGLPNDPAIVQHSAPAMSAGGSGGGFQAAPISKPASFGPVGGGVPGSSSSGGAHFPSYGGSVVPPAQQAPPQAQPPLQSPPIPPQSVNDTLLIDMNTALPPPPPDTAGTSPFIDHHIGSLSRSGSPTSSISRKSPTIDQSVQVSSAPKEDDHSRPPNAQQRRGSGGERFMGRGGGNWRNYRGRGGMDGGRGMRRGGSWPRGGKINFKDDYDFDNANQEFKEICNKLSKAKINDESTASVPDTEESEEVRKEEFRPDNMSEENVDNDEADKKFYDKDGFFDNISCEASERSKGDSTKDSDSVCYDSSFFFDTISYESIERSKGKLQRTDWRQERKLNAETFGISEYPRRMNYRGRGGMMRYGGFHRGFRGVRQPRGGNLRGNYGAGYPRVNYSEGASRNMSTPTRRSGFWGRRGRGQGVVEVN